MAQLAKQPKQAVNSGMRNVVYTLVKSKNGKYPPFYQIPAEDEVYMEWEDDFGNKQSGLRRIRYSVGETSIFVDEQSETAEKRRGVLLFNDGNLISHPMEVTKQKYLEYTNHNIANHEEGTAAPNKSAIFRSNSSQYKTNVKLQRQEKILSLSQIVNDLSAEEIEGLSLTLNVAFDNTNNDTIIASIKSARSIFFDMINYDPYRFEKELESETRRFKEVLSLALRDNIISYDKAGRSFYNNIGGKTRILDVPSYADPLDFFVDLATTRTEIKEAYKSIKDAVENNKKPAKEKFEGTKEYKMIKKALRFKVCKNAFGSISANNIGMLGERGTGIKGATQYLEFHPEVYKRIEKMVVECENQKLSEEEKEDSSKK